MADDWGAIVDQQEKSLTQKVGGLNIDGSAASGGDKKDTAPSQPSDSQQGAVGGASAGAGDSSAPKSGADGDTDTGIL